MSDQCKCLFKEAFFNFESYIRGKNINFLIGAGASAGVYNTLNIKGYLSFEDLISSSDWNELEKQVLYLYFYKEWIKPMFEIEKEINNTTQDKQSDFAKVFQNYKDFIEKLYIFLQNESNDRPRKINIFTTNYDLFFEHAYDKVSSNFPLSIFNDGSKGIFNKVVDVNYFNFNTRQSGITDKYEYSVPTINLLKLHGSISWVVDEKSKNTKVKKGINLNDEEQIFGDKDSSDKLEKIFNIFSSKVEEQFWSSISDFKNTKSTTPLEEELEIINKVEEINNNLSGKEDRTIKDEFLNLEIFKKNEEEKNKEIKKLKNEIEKSNDFKKNFLKYTIELLKNIGILKKVLKIKTISGSLKKEIEQNNSKYQKAKNELNEFYKNYENISIVNPDKGKFSSTLFQQNYFEFLRFFNYELEKPQTILIVFGFSFQDEHIRNIVIRALSNKELLVLAIAYGQSDYENMEEHFGPIDNFKYLLCSSKNCNYSVKYDNTKKGDFDFLVNTLFGFIDIKKSSER